MKYKVIFSHEQRENKELYEGLLIDPIVIGIFDLRQK